MLRKFTQLKRRTVPQTGRVILWPEEDAPEGAIRRVCLTTPESPAVALVVGPQVPIKGDLEGVDNSGATPEDIAEGRWYQWPEPDGGRDYDFHLLPEQWVAAMAEEGAASLIIFIEYLESR